MLVTSSTTSLYIENVSQLELCEPGLDVGGFC